jgi:hypothetical protein
MTAPTTTAQRVTIRPGAATVIREQLEADPRWPAGDEADNWLGLIRSVEAWLNWFEKRADGFTVEELSQVATTIGRWARNRQLRVRRAIPHVSANVNRTATDAGLIDRPNGRPNEDFAAALCLAGCDPLQRFDCVVSELVQRLADPHSYGLTESIDGATKQATATAIELLANLNTGAKSWQKI